MLLAYIKKFAESYENNKIKKAVITIPANFNKLQREFYTKKTKKR